MDLNQNMLKTKVCTIWRTLANELLYKRGEYLGLILFDRVAKISAQMA